FGDGPEDAARGQPRRAVGDAGGRDGERGQQQGRVAQRAVIGVRGPAGAYQPAAWLAAGKGGGVDPELLTALAHVGGVRGLRALGSRHIIVHEWSKRAGLTDCHRALEQLDFYTAHGDWPIEVGGGLSDAGRLLDARLDTASLLRRVDEGRVDAGLQARG